MYPCICVCKYAEVILFSVTNSSLSGNFGSVKQGETLILRLIAIYKATSSFIILRYILHY